MDNIVLTGAAGFVASHLTERLLKSDHHVIGVDIVHPSEAWRVAPYADHPNFQYVWGSASQLPLEGIADSVIIHAAAVTDIRWSARNRLYTLQRNTEDAFYIMEEAMRMSPRQVIIFSTHSVYGKQTVIPTPEDVPLKASTFYGATKVAQEAIALSYHHEHGLPVTIIRPTLMYGEQERPGALVSTFLQRGLRGQKVTLDGGGHQTRDMNYVENTADAIMLMLDQSWAHGEVFNISGNEEVSIRRLAEMVALYTDRDFDDFTIEGPPREGEEGRLFLDGSKLAKHGYAPKINFERGFEITSAWVQSQQK